MSNREQLLAQLEELHIELSQQRIDGLLINQGLVPTAGYTADSARKVSLAVAEVLPILLTRPDVTEGGYSIKFDKAGVRAYYNLLCKKLGIPNQLEEASRPKIRNRSNRW